MKYSEGKVLKDLKFITAVLNTVDALVLVLDRNGSIVLFNRLCERETGYSFDEVKGRHVWDFLLLREEVDPVRKVFENLKAGMFPNRFVNSWVRKDGTRMLVSWSNTALLDNEGKVEYVVPTGINITERNRTEKELKEKIGDLEKFYEMSVNREVKMKALKEEIVMLKSELSHYKR